MGSGLYLRCIGTRFSIQSAGRHAKAKQGWRSLGGERLSNRGSLGFTVFHPLVDQVAHRSKSAYDGLHSDVIEAQVMLRDDR